MSLLPLIAARRRLPDVPDGGSYTAVAVSFDGTNDYLTLGSELTGLSDGKAGLLSLWINFQGGNAAVQRVFTNDGGFFILNKDASNKINVIGYNSAASNILLLTSDTAYTDASGWKHVLASWDLATPEGYLYVDDADDLATSPILTDDTLDYARAAPEWVFGARHANYADKVNADVADFIFDDAFVDISVEENRRAYIDASGKPADISALSPLVKFSNPVATGHTNAGTGGGFTEGGELTAAASSPSD